MAKVGAQRAAVLTGKTKSTIQRAMKAGRLSYEVDEQGNRLIDMSELERVFGPLQDYTNTDTSSAAVKAELERSRDLLELERLKMRVGSLEDQLHTSQQQIEDMREQRDLWQKQAQQILLTSQYSQKQAEDLKSELKEREAKERAIRQRQMEERMKRLQAQQNANQNTPSGDGLWNRFLSKLRA
jgi:predicted  nucleic acid-binding Zn-ribbon protein